MKNSYGFTLLEVVFVLSVWAVLVVLSAPLFFSSIDQQQEKQFFATFQSDLMYIQNLSLGTDERIQITLNDASYEIVTHHKKENIVRTLPDGWTIKSETLTNISFNQQGTIRKPGTIIITTNKHKYYVIFRLGKGREYYIVKQ
ncbi:MAG TPA: competence type IV pilus minor pilin ComGD [Bacillota bacterium]